MNGNEVNTGSCVQHRNTISAAVVLSLFIKSSVHPSITRNVVIILCRRFDRDERSNKSSDSSASAILRYRRKKKKQNEKEKKNDDKGQNERQSKPRQATTRVREKKKKKRGRRERVQGSRVHYLPTRLGPRRRGYKGVPLRARGREITSVVCGFSYVREVTMVDPSVQGAIPLYVARAQCSFLADETMEVKEDGGEGRKKKKGEKKTSKKKR